MGKECCHFKRDVVLKPARKSPPPMIRSLLLISALSIAYIGLFSFKQMNIHENHTSVSIQLMERENQTPVRIRLMEHEASVRIQPMERKNHTSVRIRTMESTNHTSVRIQLMERAERPCQRHRVPRAEIPFLHYPEPTTYSRDACACTPVRFFAILSMQRSGSGWLETLLKSHDNISSNGEIFYGEEMRDNVSTILKTLDKVYNLDWNNSASKKKCTAAVGFKWMLNQGLMEHHHGIAQYFNRRKIHVIFLFRRNLLRQLVSKIANDHDQGAKQLNGTHKAHVQSNKEAKELAKYKPTINPKQLIPTLRAADKSAADALKSFKSTRHILLYYEDLVQNNMKLKEVQKFLGLPQKELISRDIKIHTRPLSEQVRNWHGIRKALKGTRYETFMNADYSP